MQLRRVISVCGACIAYYIGSGFATMQEVIQYEASYGSSFLVVIFVAAVIYVYTNISFACNGNRVALTRGGDIYKVYCGKYIGSFFDWFSALFCYMSFIVMCGGANSTMMQQWGLPNGVGAVILSLAVVLTVSFGLNGILKALRVLGPVIIIFILIIAGVSAVTSFGGYFEGISSVDEGMYEIEQIGGGNPIASGASYGGFVILWFAAFLGEIGAAGRLREVNVGMLVSAVCIFGVAAICCIALISNIETTWNADIPALVLANSISPAISFAFAVIIFVGIYTSATPLLWTGVRAISSDGSVRYKIITIIGGAVGCAIACFVPYTPLLNILYGLNGYLGFALIAFMVVNDVRVTINYYAQAKRK